MLAASSTPSSPELPVSFSLGHICWSIHTFVLTCGRSQLLTASTINQKRYFRDENVTVFSGLKAATFPPQISPCDLPVDYSVLTAFRGRPSHNRKSERDGKRDTKTTLVSSVACTNHFTFPGFRGQWGGGLGSLGRCRRPPQEVTLDSLKFLPLFEMTESCRRGCGSGA